MSISRNNYGFIFWFSWILGFVGAFVASALFWTVAMRQVFGAIQGAELTITWIVAVFGSWLLLVIPFMRKKEQVWKRLNTDQEKAVDVWLIGMGTFLGFLVLSAFFWSWFYSRRLLLSAGLDAAWARAVAASWLSGLVPLLIYLYRCADRIFLDASARQGFIQRYKRSAVERERRLLSADVAKRLLAVPETLSGGHVVTVELKSGQRIRDVFIYASNEILGVYDRDELGFEGADVVSVEPVAIKELPPYEESRWLRVDAVS